MGSSWKISNSAKYLSSFSLLSSRMLVPRLEEEQRVSAPISCSGRNLLPEEENVAFLRSMTEWIVTQRPDLQFDEFSGDKEKQLVADLVKIQHDGTVEVDVEKNAPAASALLKLHHTLEGSSPGVDDINSEPVRLIPRLKIAILVVGTRGDVQPFLAIAKKLQEFGHHVRLATHTNFSHFVKSAGVDFYPLGGNSRDLAEYMTRNKGFIPSGPGEISAQRKHLKVIIESTLPACTEPDLETGMPFRAQAIIANAPAYGQTHVAEALCVPLHIFFTMPWTPTNEFPHPLARVPQNTGYWLSYIIVELLIWWGIRGSINEFRRKKLKLAPIAYFSTYRGSISHLPTAYMWSPSVVPKPKDWGPLVDVVGYCFLDHGSKYQPEELVVQWIQKGTKPIYIGFGSMPLAEPQRTTDIILEALKDTGQRGIIDRGLGGLGNCIEVPENVLLIQDCSHDWLFRQCSAVVHHGGAGTTGTGLKAGCPTTIVPFFGDQFFWGETTHQKGLGPAPIPIAQLNAGNLSNAINFMLQPEVKSRAVEIAKLIESEDGVMEAVNAFHHHLPPELPLPPASVDEEDFPSPLQWFLLKVEKYCCLPCGLRF